MPRVQGEAPADAAVGEYATLHSGYISVFGSATKTELTREEETSRVYLLLSEDNPTIISIVGCGNKVIPIALYNINVCARHIDKVERIYLVNLKLALNLIHIEA